MKKICEKWGFDITFDLNDSKPIYFYYIFNIKKFVHNLNGDLTVR